MGFHNDLQKLSVILQKNLFPENPINKCISQFILKSVKGSKTQPHSGVKPQETPELHYKTPYISHFSVIAQTKRRKLANRFCNPLISN